MSQPLQIISLIQPIVSISHPDERPFWASKGYTIVGASDDRVEEEEKPPKRRTKRTRFSYETRRR